MSITASYDVTGAGTSADQGTLAVGINAAGDVTGYYADSGTVCLGFRRSPSGTITKINFPGAARGMYQGTGANSINAMNDLAGYYSDARGVGHSFVGKTSSTLVEIDAPGAGTWTRPAAVDASRAGIAGRHFTALCAPPPAQLPLSKPRTPGLAWLRESLATVSIHRAR